MSGPRPTPEWVHVSEKSEEGDSMCTLDRREFVAVNTSVAVSQHISPCGACDAYPRRGDRDCPLDVTCFGIIWVTRETYLTYRLTGLLK